jgi:hypothetical protein
MTKSLRVLPTSIALLALGFGVGCSAGHSSGLAPADPTETVREFLAAVKDSNLTVMGNLWGNEHGPASSYMPAQELRKRLTVIQIYLQHESYEFDPAGPLVVAGSENARAIAVRVLRAGCIATVPFRLLPWSGTWLIADIDLTAVGNPARPCVPQQPPQP